ncbi:cobalamin B12-binding domain-containing protein [Thermovenabulum gondwanense]|uniref:Methionine synthase n=1 Tax=Thermovenabulum gondwanense TaxID=520767 RepID=A0A162MIV8_9FIRM|nr:cobalamin-dependent protein [Thermovenabulum gondwanense]KYO66171.1 Methionine synthase [Thermovenabulum gondwanense]
MERLLDKSIVKAVEELNEDNVLMLVKNSLEQGVDPFYLLNLVKKGMDRVGRRYENKEYYIADLIMAGIIFKEVLNIIKNTDVFKYSQKMFMGKVVLGTVKGDLHDIGKEIFKGLMEASGFNVIDLGVDVPKETFVKTVELYRPEIVGMSSVLTFTVDSMKDIVDALIEADLRKDVFVIAGGSHLNQELCRYIGADYFTNDALKGVKKCKEWIEKIKNKEMQK